MKRKDTLRILLINKENKLLLIRVIDPSTTGLDKKPRNAFWCTIGGKIEQGETGGSCAVQKCNPAFLSNIRPVVGRQSC